MTGQEIVTDCLRAIGEADPNNPVELSRADCLALVNYAYQEIMGLLLNIQKSTTLTVTAGKASLPSDYLAPVRVYDSTTWPPLKQIFDIADKVDDNAATEQYWIPNEMEIYFYGITPTNAPTLYYKAKPAAIADSAGSSPTALKGKYHKRFATYIKMVMAERRDSMNTYFAMQGEWLDILDEIEEKHKGGRRDNEPLCVREVY
ncbi:MAG: hypothetical protein AB1510_02135 [Bacillota bacterium]